MTRSVATITQAINAWKNWDLSSFAVSKVVKKPNVAMTTSGSGGQAFLDGCQYIWDDNNTFNGHISLSPMDNRSGHCQSAHLTIVGASKGGNYFFDIDESGARPGSAPHGKSGKSSKKGMDLPPGLRTDVEKILDRLLTFPPAE